MHFIFAHSHVMLDNRSMPNLQNIDQAQILQWVDIGLWILLGVVLGGMLLAFFRGLIRGWKHGTFRTVFLSAMVVVLLLLMPVWIDLGGNFSIATFYSGNLSMEINNTQISVPVTTAFETAYNFIFEVLSKAFHVRASTEALIAYSIALAGSLLRLVLVFLIAFLTATVGSLLSWILWHLIFKRFSSKPKRKPKARIVSGIEEALVWFGLTAIMVIPFSGIANAIRNTMTIPEDEDNETIVLVNKVLDSYDQSVFNKIFFEWTKGEGNKTLDTQIAEFFAQNSFTTKNGYESQANFVKEISVLSSIEGSLAKWLFADEKGGSTTAAILETSLTIGETLYTWAMADHGNALTQGLVPLTLDVGANIDAISAAFPSDIDTWKEEAVATNHGAKLKRAYSRVAQSDYVSAIEDVFQGDYAVPLYADSCNFSESYLDLVRAEIESSPERHQMVNAIISGFVLGQLESNPSWKQNQQGFPALADAFADEETVLSIDWWKEANILHDVHMRLEGLSPKRADSGPTDNSLVNYALATFTEALARDPYGLIEVLIGARDAKGEPVIDAQGNNPNALCLLDSDLITTILPIALEVGADYVDETVLTEPEDKKVHDDVALLTTEFMGKSTKECRVNFKRELGHILDVPGKIAVSEPGKAFIRDYKNHPGVDITEKGTVINIDKSIAEAIISGVVEIDNSKVMDRVAAPIAEHFLRPMLASDGTLGQYGITEVALYEDYQGNRIKLGEELASILSIGVYCNDAVPIIGAVATQDPDTALEQSALLNSIFSLEDEDSNYQLTHLLDIITGSKVLNPIVKENNQIIRNSNISGLLDFLLANNMPEGFDFTIDTEDLNDIVLASDWDDEKIGERKGESFYLLQCVKTIVDSGIIEQASVLSGGDQTKLLATLATLPIQSIFTSIGNSQIMRKTGANLFDNMLLKNLFGEAEYESISAYGVTYKNLVSPEDWANEGGAIQSILDLAYRGLDLSNLDLFNPNVVDLLSRLSRSGMFFSALDEDGNLREEKEYVFPRFLKDKLLMYLNTADSIKMFIDYPEKLVDTRTVQEIFDSVSDWNNQDEIKAKICTMFTDSVALLTTPDAWQEEFGILKNILFCVKAIGGLEAMNDFSGEDVPALTKAVGYLNESKAFGPVLLCNIIRTAITSDSLPEQIADAEVNDGFLYHNTELIIEARKAGTSADAYIAARNNEVRAMLRLMDIVGSQSSIDMNLASLDVDGLLRPLLETCNASKIFNQTSVDEMYPGQTMPRLTAFETIVAKLMSQSKIFIDEDNHEVTDADTTFVKGTTLTINDIVDRVSEVTTWADEINAMCELVTTIQESSFINDAGELDLSEVSKLDQYFARSGSHEELQYLMNALQQSETFYRCLAPKLDQAVNDGLSDMNLRNIDKDMKCADFYYTRYDIGSTGHDFLPYDEDEVSRFIDALHYLSPCMHMNLDDLTTVDVDSLSMAIHTMAGSKVFNTNTEISKTIAWEDVRKGATCFQLLCSDIISVDALGDFIFLANSPKDLANAAVYSDADSKQAYIVRNLLGAMNLDGSNLASVTASADQYMGEEWGNCLRAMQSSTFESFFGDGGAKLKDLSEDNLAVLLHALNRCTIYRDCVPNALQKTLVENDDALTQLRDAGIDMSKSDFYFSYYYHDGHGHFAGSRRPDADFDMPFYEPEIDQIAMIFASLRDDSTMIDNPSFKTIDPAMLRSVLFNVHDSYVFHEATFVTLNDADELSVFQQFVRTFLLKSGVYSDALENKLDDDSYIKGTMINIHDMVRDVVESDWASEIENIYDLTRHLRSSDSFTSNEGELDLSKISDIDTFFPKDDTATREENKASLNRLLTLVERGKILYRLLPSRLEEALGDSFDGGSSMMLDIKADLDCADYFCTSNHSATALDFEPYTHDTELVDVNNDEVTSLVDLFEDIAFLKNAELTDLSSLDEAALVDAMKQMGINRIFNSNVEKSQTKFAGTKRAGLTAHQAVLCDTVYADALRSYFYNDASPKDIAHATDYGTAATKNEKIYDKIAYTIGEKIPALSGGLNAAIANYLGKSTPLFLSWQECLHDMKSPTYSEFIAQTKGVNDLTGDEMKGLLHTLNDCAFYQDIVPNALYNALIEDCPFSDVGVDFESSDIYFSYYYHDGHHGSSFSGRQADADFDMPFYDDEIDVIGDIYDDFNNNKDLFRDIPMNDPTLAPALRQTLLDMQSSYVFHNARKDDRRPEVTITSTDQTFDELTVFEQFIYKFLHDTTLHNSNYSASRDYLFGLQHPGFGAEYKLRDGILNLTIASNAWTPEINALTTDNDSTHLGTDADPVIGIIAAGQRSGIFDDSSSVNVDFTALKKIAPAKIKSLLYSINFSSLLSDVLPNSVGDLLGDDGTSGMGLNKFSTFSRVLDAPAVGDDYDGTRVIAVNSTTLPWIYERSLDAYSNPVYGKFHGLTSISFAVMSNPEGHYTVRDSANNDVTSVFPLTYTAGEATLAAKGFPGEFVVTLDVGYEIDGPVTFSYDLANYRIGQDGYRNTGIRGMGYLLSSAFRGKDYAESGGSYFSFRESGDDSLQSFLTEHTIVSPKKSDYAHSTYGLLSLFGDSGFYGSIMDVNGDFIADSALDPEFYSAGAYSFYKALNFEVEAPVEVEFDIAAQHITFSPSATISIGKYIGDGDTDESHMHAITSLFRSYSLDHYEDYAREAGWFDRFATSVGTLDVYNDYIFRATTVDELEGPGGTSVDISGMPVARITLTSNIDNAFASSSEAISSMSTALRSLKYDLDIVIPHDDDTGDALHPVDVETYNLPATVSDYARQILRGLVHGLGLGKSNTVNIDYAMPTMSGSTLKSTRIAEPTVLDDLSVYTPTSLDDEAAIAAKDAAFDNYLRTASGLFPMMEELYKDTMDDASKAHVRDGFLSLDGNTSKIVGFFYVGSLYDRMLAKGFFGYDGLLRVTDFPSLIANGRIANVDTPFSYGAIAQTIV